MALARRRKRRKRQGEEKTVNCEYGIRREEKVRVALVFSLLCLSFGAKRVSVSQSIEEEKEEIGPSAVKI